MRHERARDFEATAVEGSRLRVVATGPATRSVWRELARSAPSVHAAQTPGWLDCMCSVIPYEDASRLYEDPDGRHILLPLVRHRRTPARAPLECSLPHPWDYAGPLASGGVGPDDIAGIFADLSRRPVVRTTVRAILSTDEAQAWQSAAPPKVLRKALPTHVIDLSGGFETVWTRRFSSKVRSASRKALRRGVRVESDASGRLIPAFVDLYRKSIDRWAADRREPIRIRRLLAGRYAPATTFAAAASRLGKSCRVWIAYHDGHPGAGISVTRHRDQVMYWKGAMDRDRITGTGANELLHRRAVEWACQHGARSYHMGPHVDRYKRTFGTTDLRAVEYRFETLPLSAAEEALRAMWTRAVSGPARSLAAAVPYSS